mmetsp:Transcript_11324/g.34062  ORF Transcript_11324/g.34062 Transcript_11324/m.34062 type:complete len:104 (+) Transcript_11324:58-369(+)
MEAPLRPVSAAVQPRAAFQLSLNGVPFPSWAYFCSAEGGTATEYNTASAAAQSRAALHPSLTWRLLLINCEQHSGRTQACTFFCISLERAVGADSVAVGQVLV